jgi:hypothetical protein
MAPSEAMVLYRQMMRAAKTFNDYNFREYALRCALELTQAPGRLLHLHAMGA